MFIVAYGSSLGTQCLGVSIYRWAIALESVLSKRGVRNNKNVSCKVTFDLTPQVDKYTKEKIMFIYFNDYLFH